MDEQPQKTPGASVVEYKCPCCGAALSFAPGSQQMRCGACLNTFDLETVKDYNEALVTPKEDIHWSDYGDEDSQGWKSGEADEMQVFTCPSCGGEILTDSNTAATFCPYCENPAVIPGRVSQQFRPDFVVPFQNEKSTAKDALKRLCKGKFLLPKGFADENRLEKISGMYVPFWLYSCDVDAQAVYKATQVSGWSDSEYNYTKTDYYMLWRAGQMSFDGVPVDGSKKMDDSYMESVEPFDYSKAVDFDTAYLSGYLADKYDVTAQEGQPRANARIEATADSMLSGTAQGYATVIRQSGGNRLSNTKIRYGLLPVWMLNTKYKDKIYTFAMNGQTGKMVGELPVDKGKCWALFGGLTAGLSLLFLLVSLLF